MPDPITHYVFGRQVIAGLPENIQKIVEESIYQRALQGPDPWSSLGFYGGKTKKYSRYGAQMHRFKTGEFLMVLTQQTKQFPELFPVLAGYVCHYCLDRIAHPYSICKGGTQNGGHTRLERAIDSYYARTVYGKKPWHFSLPRQIFSSKQHPESLQPGLNAVYREVYGWEDVFPLINQSLRDERLFYGLMQDPFGIIHWLLRLIPSNKTNYSMYSYFCRDIDGEKLDYLNNSHTPWQHPFDPSVQSTDSFLDLFDRAKDEAIALIQASYEWIFLGASAAPAFGNSNYSTGLDCDDPRSGAEPQCQPLAYSGKYWN